MKIENIGNIQYLSYKKPKNKIQTNQNTTFKAQQNSELPRYSPALLNYIAKSLNNSPETFFGFDKNEINRIDFQNVQESVLDNNLNVQIDFNEVNKNVKFQLVLIPAKKLQSPNAQSVILEKMLNNKIQELNRNGVLGEEFYLSLFANRIEAELTTDNNNCVENLNNMLKLIFGFENEFTKQDFEKAKKEILENFDSNTNFAKLALFDYEINKQDVKKAKFEDIKNVCKNLILESFGKFAILVPLNFELKEEILNTLKNNIPMLKSFKNLENYSAIKEFENNIELNSNSPVLFRYYAQKDRASLRDSIILQLANEIINSNIKILNSNADSVPFELNCDVSTSPKNKYIELSLRKDEKIKSDKQKENTSRYFDELIKYTKENKISIEEFEKLKINLAEERKKRYENQALRGDLIMQTYSEGNNLLIDYLNTLKQIKYDEVYQKITNCFNNPYIQAI